LKTRKQTSREQIRLFLVAHAQADERLTPRSKQIFVVANNLLYWRKDCSFIYSAESMARFLDPKGKLNLEGLKTTIKRASHLLIKEGYMKVTIPGRGRGKANCYSPYCSKFQALYDEAEKKRVATSLPFPAEKGGEIGRNGCLPRPPLSNYHPKKRDSFIQPKTQRSSCESAPAYKRMGFASRLDWELAGCPYD
jgi:hypothetical protein